MIKINFDIKCRAPLKHYNYLKKYDIVFTVEYSIKILSRKLCLVKFDAPTKSNYVHCGAKER